MNYVQFHVGDWDSSTRLLSPMEKGIYIDLLMLYYSLERPIMRSECDRIARAYADEERRALKYVLERFFTLDGDVYRHHRCDTELEAVRAKSEKASKSAKARWQKEKQAEKVAQKEHLHMQDACKTDANAMRTQCERISERNADAMLTNNQEPITINKEVVPNGTTRQNASGTASAVPANALAAPSPAAPPEDLFEGEEDAEPKEIRFDRKDAKYPPCPYKEIVGLWHEILPELPRVNKLSAARQRVINARWKETFDEEGCKDAKECLEAFRYIFGMIRDSNFLMGRTKRSPGHENWQPTFMWVMKQENFLKVTNRDYERF